MENFQLLFELLSNSIFFELKTYLSDVMVDVHLSNEYYLDLVIYYILLDNLKILVVEIVFPVHLDFQPNSKHIFSNEAKCKQILFYREGKQHLLQVLVEHQFWLNLVLVSMYDHVLE